MGNNGIYYNRMRLVVGKKKNNINNNKVIKKSLI